MNFDQAPLTYASVTSQTLAEKGSKHVGISGMTNRKSPLTTFGITFSNSFLPIQFMYGGKIAQSIRITTINSRNYFAVYREKECRRLDNEGQPVLLIIDVFRGQMSLSVLDLLKENDIFLVRASPSQYDACISALRSHRKQIGKVIL